MFEADEAVLSDLVLAKVDLPDLVLVEAILSSLVPYVLAEVALSVHLL